VKLEVTSERRNQERKKDGGKRGQTQDNKGSMKMLRKIDGAYI
jgi:hypothetical protein